MTKAEAVAALRRAASCIEEERLCSEATILRDLADRIERGHTEYHFLPTHHYTLVLDWPESL